MWLNRTRYDAAGKRVVVVVQRGLLLVDGLLEVDLVQVECHPGDVELGQGVHCGVGSGEGGEGTN